MPDALITGAGQVASALQQACSSAGISSALLPRTALDAQNAAELRSQLQRDTPRWLIHTAALTRVNYCEEHADEALAVNAGLTERLAQACAGTEAILVLLSTDYVFDGRKPSPYLETDAPAPLNAYGRTKLAAEQVVLNSPRGMVVRTSGVFGPRADGGERNFMRAIFEQLDGPAERIPVVEGQRTAVTYAPHLAAMLLQVLSGERAQPQLPRILHLTSAGADSWYGWAKLLAVELGRGAGRIVPAAAPDNVPRPRNSVLGSAYPWLARLRAAYDAKAGIRDYLEVLASR